MFRESQIKELNNSFVNNQFLYSSLFLYGIEGTGKKKSIQIFGENKTFFTIYLNGYEIKNFQNSFGVLLMKIIYKVRSKAIKDMENGEIIEKRILELCEKFPRTVSIYSLIKILKELKYYRFLIVIDDAQYLIEHDLFDILHSIGELSNGNCMTCFLSIQPLECFNSRYFPKIIFYPAYTSKELIQLLKNEKNKDYIVYFVESLKLHTKNLQELKDYLDRDIKDVKKEISKILSVQSEKNETELTLIEKFFLISFHSKLSMDMDKYILRTLSIMENENVDFEDLDFNMIIGSLISKNYLEKSKDMFNPKIECCVSEDFIFKIAHSINVSLEKYKVEEKK